MSAQYRYAWLNPKLRPLIILIITGEIIFFLPFVLARVFRPTFLEVFDLTNLELGSCFSVYGFAALTSYLFGGIIADQVESRKLIALALWTTSFGGFYAASIPSFSGLLFLYGYWGITTIFLFWAAMIRATREWGGVENQGKAFGFLEGGRGLVAAIISGIALLFFTWSMGEKDTFEPIQRRESLQIILILTSVLVFSAGLLSYYGLPKNKPLGSNPGNTKLSVQSLVRVSKIPSVWLQALIILCAYVGYKITDDYSLFANQVLKLNQIESAGIATISLWLRPVFAVLAGLLADRWLPDRVISWGFALMALSGGFIFMGWYSNAAWITYTFLATALVGIYGLRGVYYAIMNRGAIPFGLTGTAVGLISLLGYTPDIFLSPIMGYLLDTYPGARGHEMIFGLLGAVGLLGFATSLFFGRYTKPITLMPEGG